MIQKTEDLNISSQLDDNLQTYLEKKQFIDNDEYTDIYNIVRKLINM